PGQNVHDHALCLEINFYNRFFRIGNKHFAAIAPDDEDIICSSLQDFDQHPEVLVFVSVDVQPFKVKKENFPFFQWNPFIFWNEEENAPQALRIFPAVITTQLQQHAPLMEAHILYDHHIRSNGLHISRNIDLLQPAKAFRHVGVDVNSHITAHTV